MMSPSGLFCDLYELTMGSALLAEGLHEVPATFELFVRSLPPGRPWLVADGVDAAIEAVTGFGFDDDACAWLADAGLVAPAFVEHLRGFRFTGDVRAVAAGEVLPAGVPLLSVEAPLLQAQLLETVLINRVALATMLTTTGALLTEACAGRSWVDFSARRDHGHDAAMAAARSAWVAGAAGTSLVAAARRWDIPAAGTMAHSYVMAHDDEQTAFEAFLRHHGPDTVLLIDTYDTVRGADRAIAAMRAVGHGCRAVRLDSGDLADLAGRVRGRLDDAGHPEVRILVSGDLDAAEVSRLVATGAPIDAFGVGTRFGTSADAPHLGAVYKLVESAGRGRRKVSPGKRTLPGRKQVWRRPDGSVHLAGIAEPAPPGTVALLEPVVVAGRVIHPVGPVGSVRAADATRAARARRAAGVARHGREPVPLTVSAALDAAAEASVPGP
jgi:nicotinate phosphoribosyltransferase